MVSGPATSYDEQLRTVSMEKLAKISMHSMLWKLDLSKDKTSLAQDKNFILNQVKTWDRN